MDYNGICRSRVYILYKWQDPHSTDDDAPAYHFSLKEIWSDNIGFERPQLAEEATITARFKPASAFIIRTWAIPTQDAATQYRVQIEHIPTGARKFLTDVNMLWHFITDHGDIDTYEHPNAIAVHTASM